jgi:hypothetical protein
VTARLAIRVMHAAFSADRRRLLLQLRQRLGPVRPPHTFAVVADRKKSGCWPIAHAAWIAASTAPGATHAFVMQDDNHPCPHFLAAVETILALRPDQPISLATNRPQLDRVDGAWLKALGATWGGGTILPVAIARDFIRWCDRYFPDPPWDLDDDMRLVAYLSVADIPTYITVPGLIQHLGARSLLGHSLASPLMQPRRFIGFDGDPRSVDWSLGLADPPVAAKSPYPAQLARRMPPALRRAAGFDRYLGVG